MSLYSIPVQTPRTLELKPETTWDRRVVISDLRALTAPHHLTNLKLPASPEDTIKLEFETEKIALEAMELLKTKVRLQQGWCHAALACLRLRVHAPSPLSLFAHALSFPHNPRSL
jgi:ubiquinone biosynthesis protein COQ9